MCVALSHMIVEGVPLVVVCFSGMAHKGKAKLRHSCNFISVLLVVCLAPLTKSYNLRKALGRNRQNGHEGKILFGNYFEKGRTSPPSSIQPNWVVSSSAEDTIDYQGDSAGGNSSFILSEVSRYLSRFHNSVC